MTNTEAISKFIKGSLAKQKHERYLGLISSQKGRIKFLKELDHSIDKVMDTAKFKESLTESEWNEIGYLYSSNGVFGKCVENIQVAYEGASWDGGWLIINEAGTAGILRPEGRMDDELYIRL